MKKITKVADRDIDGRTPHMSISVKMYDRVMKKLRKQAKKEKKRLVTNNGIEDYTEG